MTSFGNCAIEAGTNLNDHIKENQETEMGRDEHRLRTTPIILSKRYDIPDSFVL